MGNVQGGAAPANPHPQINPAENAAVQQLIQQQLGNHPPPVHFCERSEDGSLTFDHRTSESGVVYDKWIQEGQLITRASDGVIGRVIGVKCKATVSLNNYDGTSSEFVIPDIPLERIKPVSCLYPGSTVTHNGWLGTVENVTNEWHLLYVNSDGITCRTLLPMKSAAAAALTTEAPSETFSFLHHSTTTKAQSQSQPFIYPYKIPSIPSWSRIPLPHQEIRLCFRQLRYSSTTNWNGHTSWKRPQFMLAWHFKLKPATVHRTETNMVTVRWNQRYCGEAEQPPAEFNSEQCRQLRPRFLLPHEYIHQNSVVQIEWSESDQANVTTRAEWSREFWEELQAHNEEDGGCGGGSRTAKRPRVEDNNNNIEAYFRPIGTTCPVTVLMLRHELEVDWNGRPTLIMASKVEIPTHESCEKYVSLMPWLIDEDYANEIEHIVFGVTHVTRPDDVKEKNMIDVCWVRKRVRVAAVNNQMVVGEEENAVLEEQQQEEIEYVIDEPQKESAFDVYIHQKYERFNVGQFVTKSECCTHPELDFGVIRRITFDGKIIVHTASNDATAALELWPCEIQQVCTSPAATQPQEEKRNSCRGTIEQIIENLTKYQDSLGLSYLPTKDFLPKAPALHSFYNETSFTSLSKEEQRKFRFQIFFDYMNMPLPKNVWIRGYDDRYDLHTLLVIGPPGTPFDGMPFTFDIYLPPKYPFVQPLIRLNQTYTELSPYILDNGLLDYIALKLNTSPFPETMQIDNVEVSLEFMIRPLFNVINYIHASIFTRYPFKSENEELNQPAKLAKDNQSVFMNSLDTCLDTLGLPPDQQEPWGEHIFAHYAERLPKMVETLDQLLNGCGRTFPFATPTEGFIVAINRRLGLLRQIIEQLPFLP